MKSLALQAPRIGGAPRGTFSVSYRSLPTVAALLDALVIVTTGLVSTSSYHSFIGMNVLPDLPAYLALAILAAVIFVALVKNGGLYEVPQLLNVKLQLGRVTVLWTAVFLFLAATAFAAKVGGTYSRGATISFASSALFAILCCRVIWRLVLASGLALRTISGRQVAVFADSAVLDPQSVSDLLLRHGFQPVESFPLPASVDSPEAADAMLSHALGRIRGSQIEEIVICADLSRCKDIHGFSRQFRSVPLPVQLIPFGAVAELLQFDLQKMGDHVAIELQTAPRSLAERAVKRAMDVILSVTAIVLLSPLLLIVAAIIKMDSRGPIIFRQRRSGFNGRVFHILKFRTMTVLEDGADVVQAGRNDWRITRFGKWMRRTSIDELPQLFNVLMGNMSIVGPRPHAISHDDEFSKIAENYAFRHHVKPGITGWAQVNGYRGETKTSDQVRRRVELDLYYIDNWNVLLDLKILFMTMVEVARGENAY